MILTVRTAILFIFLIFAGCAPELISVLPTEPVPDSADLSGYEKAEDLFENGRYMESLDGFNSFLRKTEGGFFADAALLKIGLILRKIGSDDDALTVFARMIREYPESPLLSDAVLEILTIEYDKGDFASVIAMGTTYTDSTDLNLSRNQLFFIIADAYGMLGANLDAARFYYRAWNTELGVKADTARVAFNRSIEELDADALRQLFTEVKDPSFTSTLLYKLSMAFILEERYDEALDVLQIFVDRYPDHPERQDAQDIMKSIVERSRFASYTVGCVLPLTGAYGVYGRRALDGIELALVQSMGKNREIPFRLFIQDSMSDEKETVKAMAALDQQKVGVVLGPMIASKHAALSAQTRGIPIFVFTQREGIVDIGPYVFRNFLTPQMQARSLVSFAVEELDAKRFAILFPEEKYGRRYMNLFWDQVIEYNGVVTAVEPYDPKRTDFAESIRKLAGIYYDIPKKLSLRSVPELHYPTMYFIVNPDLVDSMRIDDPVERISGIPLDRDAIEALGRRARDAADQWHPIIDFDAVFIPDAPKKAGLAIPQLAYYDVRDVLLLGTNLWNSTTLLKMAGGYAKDALIVDGFFSESKSGKIKQFVMEFQQVYGRTPGLIEAIAYDNAMIVLRTMSQIATDSRRELKQAFLEIGDYQGVSGHTAFLPNGEADKSLQMLRINKGKFVEVKQKESFTK